MGPDDIPLFSMLKNRLGYLTERQKVVAFSDTIFVSSIRAVVRKDAPIRAFEDLGGRPVSLTSGSTSSLMEPREFTWGVTLRLMPTLR